MQFHVEVLTLPFVRMLLLQFYVLLVLLLRIQVAVGASSALGFVRAVGCEQHLLLRLVLLLLLFLLEGC